MNCHICLWIFLITFSSKLVDPTLLYCEHMSTVQSESQIWTEREVSPLLINILGYPTEWFSSNMSHFAGYHLSLPFYPV